MSECRFCRRAFPQLSHYWCLIFTSFTRQDKTKVWYIKFLRFWQTLYLYFSFALQKFENWSLDFKHVNADLGKSVSLQVSHPSRSGFLCLPSSGPPKYANFFFFFFMYAVTCVKGKKRKDTNVFFFLWSGKRLCLFNKSVVSTVTVYDLTDVLCFFHFTQISALKSLSTCSINACQ